MIQGTSGGTEKKEEKPIEIEGVEEWEIERILNKENKRSGQVFSAMEEVYGRK